MRILEKYGKEREGKLPFLVSVASMKGGHHYAVVETIPVAVRAWR